MKARLYEKEKGEIILPNGAGHPDDDAQWAALNIGYDDGPGGPWVARVIVFGKNQEDADRFARLIAAKLEAIDDAR